ncbi:MAG TPA: AAA family ATPase [Plasticicumulans sp.]|uniref:ParA family protein n=1 Tax=Plasticicumulans sp. TaxID=2307179 RepID=UPI002D0772C5|nr:AAA family ATPase [Plasticicumulans sp.]HMW31140.1 AAA family ATPase [Plasticicumulans sp.]HNI22073.1 AAA family ATPase [Plasticicumulans sp.]
MPDALIYAHAPSYDAGHHRWIMGAFTMQALRFNFRTLCRNAAERGEQLQARLLDALGARHGAKALPDFGIERAAQLIGCTANYIRSLEARAEAPQPRLIEAGSLQRRVYNYNDVNHLRTVMGRGVHRPDGAAAARVVFSNLKGGVAKTTMSLHFAQYCAREGYRVLLVDADPQATTTGAFGFIPDLDLGDGDDLSQALLAGPQHLETAIRRTHWAQLDLLPSRLALQYVDWQLSQPAERTHAELGAPPVRLTRALAQVEDRYDLIVIDTPPSLGMLSINAIAAASLIVMPIVPHMYDISSSVQYFRILEQVCELYAREIDVARLAILLTKVDNSTETLNNIAVINGAYGELILSNRMGLTKELQKSASDQLSIYEIDQPRGSRDTYHRAVMMLDAVNSELLLAVRQLWQQQVLVGIEAAEAGHGRVRA